jgi:glyoxylase-like metal-dependent hydrolase (beta-lactamase superfamily II)
MLEPYKAGADVYVLPTDVAIPGVGHLPINAFLLLSEEPVLIDSGIASDGPEFVEAVEAILPPADIKWIWLTHDDADHTGSIQRMAEAAPNARLVMHAFAAMRMATWWPVPLERVYAIQPGNELHVGDRTLRAVAPPTFDNPMSTGLYDTSSGALFTVDAFGALLPEVTTSADDIPEDVLAQGMIGWGLSDSPWTRLVDTSRFEAELARIGDLQPSRILSSHLPAAGANIDRFISVIRNLPSVEPELPPDHVAFSQMLEMMLAEQG